MMWHKEFSGVWYKGLDISSFSRSHTSFARLDGKKGPMIHLFGFVEWYDWYYLWKPVNLWDSRREKAGLFDRKGSQIQKGQERKISDLIRSSLMTVAHRKMNEWRKRQTGMKEGSHRVLCSIYALGKKDAAIFSRRIIIITRGRYPDRRLAARELQFDGLDGWYPPSQSSDFLTSVQTHKIMFFNHTLELAHFHMTDIFLPDVWLEPCELWSIHLLFVMLFPTYNSTCRVFVVFLFSHFVLSGSPQQADDSITKTLVGFILFCGSFISLTFLLISLFIFFHFK